TAFGKPFVWWVKDELDFPRMRRGAAAFVGMHDFQSFSADDPGEKSTQVKVETVELREDGDLILVRVEGSHFLWKMVRRMVGVIVEAGRGGITPEQAEAFLREESAAPAKLTAPASGLFLERVYYQAERERRPLRGVVDVRRN